MIDSHLAKLILSENADEVIINTGQGDKKEQENAYVKGFTTISFANVRPSQNPEGSEQKIVGTDINDDSDSNTKMRPTNEYKISNKQFTANLRQLREFKDDQEINGGGNSEEDRLLNHDV